MKKHIVPLDEIVLPPSSLPSLQTIHETLPGGAEMSEIARNFQALSDPTRCKIVLALTRYELRVTDLAEVVGVSISLVSHHLKGLKDIRLVKFRREGNNIFYSIDDEHVGNLFRELISHLDHVYRNLPDHRSQLEKEAALNLR